MFINSILIAAMFLGQTIQGGTTIVSGGTKTGDGTAAAAPPSTPVITTSSLADGTEAVAYSETVSATDGTVPYVWSISVGALPAGLSIGSGTGTISGTPTAGGVSAFTVLVTDALAQTYDKALSITIAADPSPPLWADGFESNDFSAWDGVTSGSSVQSSIKNSGSYAAQFPYVICNDQEDPSCGSGPQDTNKWAVKLLSPALSHVFMRGYVYIKTPENGIEGAGAQRKLIWIGDEDNAGSNGKDWDIILTTFESIAGAPGTMRLAALSQGSTCMNGGELDWMNGVDPLSYDTWYSIEIEGQTNTPSASAPYDGIFRVWVDGVKVLDRTDFKINGNCSSNFQFFSIGRQTNRYSWQAIDELRYWDDIVIDESYIGP